MIKALMQVKLSPKTLIIGISVKYSYKRHRLSRATDEIFSWNLYDTAKCDYNILDIKSRVQYLCAS